MSKALAEVATWPKLAKPEDVKLCIQQNIKDGADYINRVSLPHFKHIDFLRCQVHERGKMLGQKFNLPSVEMHTAIVKAAHRHRLVTAAHAMSLEDTLAILKTGFDDLTHTFSDEPPTRELVEAYKANNTFYIPTLLIHGSVTGEGEPIAATFANDPRAIAKIADAEKASMSECIYVGAQTCKSVECV